MTMFDQLLSRPLRRTTSSPASPTVGPTRWSGRWGWPTVLSLLLLFLAGVGALAWWGLDRTSAIRYSTTPATRGLVARTVSATGTVNPELTIIVGSYVSGVIQSLSCDYNTRVKAGQVCARIDPRPYQSLVDQAKANLGIAKAQLEKDKASLAYAKINAGRRQLLAERESESRDVADLAKSVYDQAQAQIGLDEATIELRQAALDSAIVNLGYADIVSPVDGTVVSRNVTQGQTVAASFQTPTLFLIATDLTKMQVDANISESDIGGIAEGNKATFTVDAYQARVFEGVVSQVRQSPQTVQNVVTYDTVISVPNPDLTLKPGMTASTRIVIDQRADVLRVPNAALRYTPPGVAAGGMVAAGTGRSAARQSRVWVLRDGAPVALAVVTGLDDENFTEIVSGALQSGDLVIVGSTTAAGNAAAMSPPRV